MADSPSVRAILGALLVRERMTGADLRAASGLPRRTVYSALRVRRERGLVRQRKSLQDTRQSSFWLVESAAVHQVAAERRDVAAVPMAVR